MGRCQVARLLPSPGDKSSIGSVRTGLACRRLRASYPLYEQVPKGTGQGEGRGLSGFHQVRGATSTRQACGEGGTAMIYLAMSARMKNPPAAKSDSSDRRANKLMTRGER